MRYSQTIWPEVVSARAQKRLPVLPAPLQPELKNFRQPAELSNVPGVPFHYLSSPVAADSLRTVADEELEPLWTLAISGLLPCLPPVPVASSALCVAVTEVFRRWVDAAENTARPQRQQRADSYLEQILRHASTGTPEPLFFELDDQTDIIFRRPNAVARRHNPEIIAERS